MKIFTTNLSPAYDVHIFSEGFACGKENHARITSYEAGGKGLNVSRALTENGVPNTLVSLLGSENDAVYRDTLKKLGGEGILIPVPGRIRENMTVHDESGRETRICFDAPKPGTQALLEAERRIEEELRGGTDCIITFTGRMPEGIPKKEMTEFIEKLQEKGAKTVIDSKSFDFKALRKLKPWLIKPNSEEISEALGYRIESPEDVAAHAGELQALGIEHVMVSLGGEGAVLLSGGRILHAKAESVTPVSTIGAGDSTVAGFIEGEVRGLDTEEKLLNAVAFGTAACLKAGTQPPDKETVEQIRKNIQMRYLK